ncbi:unnamed protein product [Plutella xylostella]|uniref:(diamondback moth) hypothetical protein n=1 Tax=Plutella xylostella TaxID=51655 RepID=A0A8S4G1F9_PLUXY|nr:unnamed protein product [Plutella xylostella]
MKDKDKMKFVLVEELEWGGRAGSGPQQRALADDEVVYTAQANWKTLGRFVLQEGGCSAPLPRHRAAIARIQRGLSITRPVITEGGCSAPLPRHRAAIARIQRGLSITRPVITGSPFPGTYSCIPEVVTKHPVQAAYSDPTHCRRVSTTPLGKGIGRSKGHSDKDMRSFMNRRSGSREVHSEGEAGGSLSAEALAAQVARFKRVSLRKLRAWRS